MLSEAIERASPPQLEEELGCYRASIAFLNASPHPSVFLDAWYKAVDTARSCEHLPMEFINRVDAELQREAHRCGIRNAAEFTGGTLKTVVDAARLAMAQTNH